MPSTKATSIFLGLLTVVLFCKPCIAKPYSPRSFNLANTTSTISSAQPTSTTNSAIATKTAVADCHYQGLPGPIVNYQIDLMENSPDELSCQTYCESVPKCLSYELWGEECFLFNVTIFSDPAGDGIALVIPSLVGGIFWSDRFPEDGSGFCFGGGEGENSMSDG